MQVSSLAAPRFAGWSAGGDHATEVVSGAGLLSSIPEKSKLSSTRRVFRFGLTLLMSILLVKGWI